MKSENKIELEQGGTTKNIKTNSINSEWIIIGGKKKWGPRNCPNCNKEIYYKHEKSLHILTKRNPLCRVCSNKILSENRRVIGPFNLERYCPKCNEIIYYKSRFKRLLAEQEGTDCKSCCKTGTANPMYGKFGTLHPHFGKHHSDQTKKNIADHQPDKTGKNGSMYGKCSYDVWLKNHGKEFADKKLQEWKNKLSVAQSGSNNFWYGKKHSEESKIKIGNAHRGKIMSSESKRKMRVSAINRISQQKFNGGQIRPSFNPKSCKIIDEYGKQNGYKFQHAMNGGEFFIKELGYWVDGYDKEKNVVFEYDEEHHNWKKQKDDFRMNEIKNHLKCKFIRLNEKTGKIKKY